MTGAPKGATLTHHNILNNGFFVGEAMRLTEQDRLCIPVPLYVIPHPLSGTCFCREISPLRQYRAAAALKVIVGEMPVVRRVAKRFWSSLLERYWPEAEHLSNGLGSAV